MTIMAGRSLIAALMFYLVYDEKLKFKHILGMFLLIGCIACIAIGTETKSATAEEEGVADSDYNSMTMVIIVCGCLFNCIIYTFSAFLARISS